MSRLDSFIRRLMAQRDILNAAAPLVPPKGDILEIGLGNGRTYSHLRELFPLRRIVAFDRALAAHQGCIPDSADLVLGEIRETATTFVGKGAALVHADIGTGYPVKDAETLTWLPVLVESLAGPDGLAISGLPLATPLLSPLELPQGIQSERYFLYRKSA